MDKLLEDLSRINQRGEQDVHGAPIRAFTNPATNHQDGSGIHMSYEEFMSREWYCMMSDRDGSRSGGR